MTATTTRNRLGSTGKMPDLALRASAQEDLRTKLLDADHPRGRGEHAWKDVDALYERGSSPQARGALRQHALRQSAFGIIPAGAGSTSTASAGSSRTSDHPRGRGEHGTSARRDRSLTYVTSPTSSANSGVVGGGRRQFAVTYASRSEPGSPIYAIPPFALEPGQPRGCPKAVYTGSSGIAGSSRPS